MYVFTESIIANRKKKWLRMCASTKWANFTQS
jgi:hypothetical protein